jgi:hypothetical protein
MKDFILSLAQGEFCFQKAVGGLGYCNAIRHSSSQFYKIEDLNNMIISQMFSDTDFDYSYLLYPSEVR